MFIWSGWLLSADCFIWSTASWIFPLIFVRIEHSLYQTVKVFIGEAHHCEKPLILSTPTNIILQNITFKFNCIHKLRISQLWSPFNCKSIFIIMMIQNVILKRLSLKWNLFSIFGFSTQMNCHLIAIRDLLLFESLIEIPKNGWYSYFIRWVFIIKKLILLCIYFKIIFYPFLYINIIKIELKSLIALLL